MNKRDLLALYVVGPTVTRPVQDPLSCATPRQMTMYAHIYAQFMHKIPNFADNDLTGAVSENISLHTYIVGSRGASQLGGIF